MIHPFQNLLCILLGSLATTFAFAVFNHKAGIAFLVVVFLVALAHSLFLGLPIYLVLPKKFKNHWSSPLIIGFVIGTILPLYFSADSVLRNIMEPAYLDGMRQTGALKEDITTIFSGGFLGMIGAMSAWTMWMHFQININKPKD